MVEKDELVARLKKVEGQIRGIQKMVADERPCPDVITQVVAAGKALDKVALMIIERSMHECAAKSRTEGADGVEQLGDAVKLLFDLAKRG